MTITTSPEINHIAAALLQFQSSATGVVKDSKNPHFKNRYASLEAVIDEARPKLQAAGIAWLQAPGHITNGNLALTTILMHAASGQWISSTMEIPLGKNDPQGAGSAITYSSRYALMATLGLPPVDDDAEGAMRRDARPAPAPVRVTSGTDTLSQAARAFMQAMNMAQSRDDLGGWMSANAAEMDRTLPPAEVQTIRDAGRARYMTLPEAERKAG